MRSEGEGRVPQSWEPAPWKCLDEEVKQGCSLHQRPAGGVSNGRVSAGRLTSEAAHL
jgi:hypothetical protein